MAAILKCYGGYTEMLSKSYNPNYFLISDMTLSQKFCQQMCRLLFNLQEQELYERPLTLYSTISFEFLAFLLLF